MDIGQGLASFGASMAGAMDDYHKKHAAYDEQMQLAQALSRLGINEQGQITPMDMGDGKKQQGIQPIIDKKALDIFTANNRAGYERNAGALEALNRMAVHGLAPLVGQMGQEQLKAHQLANQRYDTTIGGQTYPLTAAGAATAGMEQQRIDIAKQPKGPSASLQYRKEQDAIKQQQKAQEALPEFQFQKKYQVMPKDILSQPMAYDTQFENPNETDPSKKKVSAYVPTTPVYRERKVQTNQNGVKQEVFAPDPNGEIVNFKGQRIPFQEYSTLLNRQQFVYDRAKAALQRGTPPDEVAKRLESMGFDPAGVK